MADFSSIGEMMQNCADEAVHIAREQFGFVLDYSEASLKSLETILTNVGAGLDLSDKDGVEETVKIWGSYFGETVRRNCGGTWEMIQYPGRAAALPTLVIGGSQLYPLMKVYRRFSIGESENVWEFYERVRSKICPAHPTEESTRSN